MISAFLLAQSGFLAAQELSSSATAARMAVPTSAAALNDSAGTPMGSSDLMPRLLLPAKPALVAPITPIVVSYKKPGPHAFWDRENRILFGAVGAAAAADFCATHANLASGGKELNPMTRVFSGSTPGLATNFALEAGGVVGISYLFHRTGHHKLERVTSFVNIGASATAAAYSFVHR